MAGGDGMQVILRAWLVGVSVDNVTQQRRYDPRCISRLMDR